MWTYLSRSGVADWSRISEDLQRGVIRLIEVIGELASRAGREVMLVERRRALARVEQQLARLHRELGETVYEHWLQAPDTSLQEPRMVSRLEEIAALATELDERRREVADVARGWSGSETTDEAPTELHEDLR